MFGDTTGHTEFTAVDIDLRSNVILGGYSRSTQMCGTGCSVPLIVYYTAGAQSRWARRYSSLNEQPRVTSVKFQQSTNASATALVTLERNGAAQPLMFIILNTVTGAMVSAYWETSRGSNLGFMMNIL